MLYVVIGIVVAIVGAVAFWATDEEIIGAILGALLGLIGGFCISGSIGCRILYHTVDYKEPIATEYPIENTEDYYSIASNGKVSVSIINEDGDCVPVSYDSDIVKFKKGKTAKVTVSTKEPDWSEAAAFWFGLNGTFWEPSEVIDSVIITIPVENYVETESVCPACEKEIEENDQFCGSCGVEIATHHDEHCSNCKNKINEDDAFCRHCGSKIK